MRRLTWLIATLIVIHFSSNLFVFYMKDAHKYFNKILKSQRITSSDTASISTTDSSWYEKNKAVTIMRIYAKENPLHLRQATFNLYSKKTWSNEYQDNRKATQRVISSESSSQFLTRIQRTNNPFSKQDHSETKCDIMLSFVAPSLLFTTNKTIWVKTKRPITEIKTSGTIKTFVGKLGYSIYQNNDAITPKEDIQANYTYSKIELASTKDQQYIKELSREIVGQEKKIERKVNLIHQYLVKNFKYELFPEPPPEEHLNRPIVHFLQTADKNGNLNNSKPAHCQYFASSSVMLLRAQNIPSRYVIGYLCQRYNEFGGYWYVNKTDAHAWVEYYDNGWKTFDPTKNLVITDETSKILSGYEGVAEFLKFKVDTWFFLLGSGQIGYILEQWWDSFIEVLAESLFVIYIAIIIFMGAFIYFFLKRKTNKEKSTFLLYEKSHHPEITKLLKKLSKLEKKLKKLNVLRTTSTTLSELQTQIEISELSEEDKAETASIIERLQSLIYSKPL